MPHDPDALAHAREVLVGYDELIDQLRAENAALRALLVELLHVVKAVEENLQATLDKDRI